MRFSGTPSHLNGYQPVWHTALFRVPPSENSVATRFSSRLLARIFLTLQKTRRSLLAESGGFFLIGL